MPARPQRLRPLYPAPSSAKSSPWKLPVEATRGKAKKATRTTQDASNIEWSGSWSDMRYYEMLVGCFMSSGVHYKHHLEDREPPIHLRTRPGYTRDLCGDHQQLIDQCPERTLLNSRSPPAFSRSVSDGLQGPCSWTAGSAGSWFAPEMAVHIRYQGWHTTSRLGHTFSDHNRG